MVKEENTALPQELLTVVAEIASNAAISFYKEEIKKAEKDKASKKTSKTRQLLKSYRQIKAKINDAGTFTNEEKAEYRWKFLEDLMGNAKDIVSKSDRIVQEIEKNRQEDMYALYRIENAVRLYKEECDISKSEEKKRRFRELSALYIDDEAKSIEEIAEAENVSEKTVYRDIGISVKILSIYLFGI